MVKMSDPKVKLGRPFKGNEGGMRKVTFRVDEETDAALKVLEESVGPRVRGRTSILLRKLILDAFVQRKSNCPTESDN